MSDAGIVARRPIPGAGDVDGLDEPDVIVSQEPRPLVYDESGAP